MPLSFIKNILKVITQPLLYNEGHLPENAAVVKFREAFNPAHELDDFGLRLILSLPLVNF